MKFIKAIEAYLPVNRQEEQDKQVILNFIKEYGSQALLRDNEIAGLS